MIVAPGTTNLTIIVQVVDDAGLPVTGLAAADLPTIHWAVTLGVPDVITPTDLSSINDLHMDGGWAEHGGGWYRLDLPYYLVRSQVARVWAEGDNLHLLAEPMQVQVFKPLASTTVTSLLDTTNPILATVLGVADDVFHVGDVVSVPGLELLLVTQVSPGQITVRRTYRGSAVTPVVATYLLELVARGDYTAQDVADAVTADHGGGSYVDSGGTDLSGVEGDINTLLSRTAGGVTYTGPVTPGGDLTVIRGDSYQGQRALSWSHDGWPDLTGAQVVLSAVSRQTGRVDMDAIACEVTNAGQPTQTITVELASPQTAGLDLGGTAYRFDLQATVPGGPVVTLMIGNLAVRGDATI